MATLLDLMGAPVVRTERLTPDPEPASAIAYFVRIPGPVEEALTVCRVRMVVMLIGFVLLMGMIAVRLATVSLQGDQVQERPKITKAATKPPTQRAGFVDRNGQMLATNLKTASVYANPRQMRHPEEAADAILTVFPELDRQKLVRRFASDRSFVWIKRDITPEEKFQVNALGVPGVYFQQEEQRIYPHGALLGHVLGYVNIDNKGIAGMEKSLDGMLVDPSRDANAVELSLDLRVQHALYEVLKEGVAEFEAKAAVGVVANAYTGEILAMVSLPDFDPNHPAMAKPAARFNRATLGVYEMGSTFKSFTMAMALDSGVTSLKKMYDVSEPIRYARYVIRDTHPQKKPISLPEVYAHSSNIGTVKIAQSIGMERQQEYFHKLGLLSPLKVELPERGSPIVPSPWRDVNMMTASFGHGIAVSPLHVVRATAAMVNGGFLPRLTLLKTDPELAMEHATAVIKPETSDRMRQLMRLAVAQGTGKKAEVPGYQVGGKTGTAEKLIDGAYRKEQMLVSFAGAFPMQQPQYVTLVLLDEPKGNKQTYGFANAGWTAAPITGRLVERIAPLLGVAPAYTDDTTLLQQVLPRVTDSTQQAH